VVKSALISFWKRLRAGPAHDSAQKEGVS
jgi:hypothetical protein